MNLFFIGGEDSDFTSIGNVGVDTTSTHFRSSYARCALMSSPIAVGGCWAANFDAPHASFWATARLYITLNSNVTSSAASRIMAFTDNGTVRLAIVPNWRSFVANNTFAWQLVKIDATGTITILATAAVNLDTNLLQKLDVFVNYATAGQVQVFLDGTKIIDYSGNVTTNSATTLSSIQLGSPCADGAAGATYWSECVVADTDTRGMALATLAVNAAGNAQQWSGANTDINETTLNDATAISSLSNGQISEWTVTVPSAITTTTGVLAVAVSARAAKGTSGPQNLAGMVRSGGADYASSNMSGLAATLGKVQTSWLVNPATGLAWSASDLLNAGFNIGLQSAA